MITVYSYKCFKWHNTVKLLTILNKTPFETLGVHKFWKWAQLSDYTLSSRDIQTLQNLPLVANWYKEWNSTILNYPDKLKAKKMIVI